VDEQGVKLSEAAGLFSGPIYIDKNKDGWASSIALLATLKNNLLQ